MKYPRDVAVRVITRVLSERHPLDEALAAVSGEIAPEARAWLQEATAGALRWRGRIELAIDSAALKKKPSGWLRKALLVAGYQLIVQERTNPGAVVSETVDLVRKKEGQAPAGFANAVLRRIGEQSSRWRALPWAPGLGDREAAQWASMPDWLWHALSADRGEEWTARFAQACLERPRIWLRAKGELPGAEPGPVPGSYALQLQGPVTSLPGWTEGRVFVQDISSQLLVHEAGELAREKGARSALDLCAAPGGKSAGLAWEGLEVTATDRDEARISLLKQTLGRVAPSAKAILREEAGMLPAQDFVWVDAPCSGSGIIRRHPDVRWLRRESELEGLVKVQAELAREGWAKTRPGGLFLFSVCSVLKREGEDLLRSLSLRGETLRSWLLEPQAPPHGDGFWAALVQKSS